ncbi:unnamed protein product [Adineta steineri]|uniref:G-protein coupled receptors family 1 profile domain-containing protein n=1 Tax=Adineta steineri TaxID=433720 RepID=A0A815YDM1_9BILA|nr:unnamed protein product [Adineta steineri]CAF0923245.1 unnamed protein product [Adineta steineri]CAF1291427.1 unnamed protein product [Adineta steineri]CAF1569373.1 unnamed protein product [Adineta steineri]
MADDATESLRWTKYVVLQSTIVPSLLCDIYVFIYFIRHWQKEIVKSPQHHVIICMLIISFLQKTTDAPLLLFYLRWGENFQQTYTFCAAWNWLDCTLTGCAIQLAAWFCIERHLFIFHSQLMKKKWCSILFHYIPLFVYCIYLPIFYAVVIFFPRQCTNIWDYSVVFCGGACYNYSDPFLPTFDWLFHYALSLLIILFANLLLFYRVIYQKLRQLRPIDWHRQRRMIIQLLFISTTFIILQSPSIVIGVIEALWSPTFAFDIQYNYFAYLYYFINQLLPFVIIGSLPNMRKEIQQWFQRIKRRLDEQPRIHPGTTIA